MTSISFNQFILNRILTEVSSQEKTEELRDYWLRKYKQIINKGLFTFTRKTISYFSSDSSKLPLEKPVTPMGRIHLSNHLQTDGKTLDELALQDTIETSVRLLDMFLEILNFHPKIREIVCDYRKIALGIADFEIFASLQDQSEAELIDYLGNIISNTAYRASESLAEEIGTANKWSEFDCLLRDKSFEYWYDIETGDIRSGSEMCEIFDSESVKQSNFRIIPRRNTHILALPLGWEKWSDRENLSSKLLQEMNQDTDGQEIVVSRIPVFGDTQSQESEMDLATESQISEEISSESQQTESAESYQFSLPKDKDKEYDATEPLWNQQVDDREEVTFISTSENYFASPDSQTHTVKITRKDEPKETTISVEKIDQSREFTEQSQALDLENSNQQNSDSTVQSKQDNQFTSSQKYADSLHRLLKKFGFEQSKNANLQAAVVDSNSENSEESLQAETSELVSKSFTQENATKQSTEAKVKPTVEELSQLDTSAKQEREIVDYKDEGISIPVTTHTHNHKIAVLQEENEQQKEEEILKQGNLSEEEEPKHADSNLVTNASTYSSEIKQTDKIVSVSARLARESETANLRPELLLAKREEEGLEFTSEMQLPETIDYKRRQILVEAQSTQEKSLISKELAEQISDQALQNTNTNLVQDTKQLSKTQETKDFLSIDSSERSVDSSERSEKWQLTEDRPESDLTESSLADTESTNKSTDTTKPLALGTLVRFVGQQASDTKVSTNKIYQIAQIRQLDQEARTIYQTPYLYKITDGKEILAESFRQNDLQVVVLEELLVLANRNQEASNSNLDTQIQSIPNQDELTSQDELANELANQNSLTNQNKQKNGQLNLENQNLQETDQAANQATVDQAAIIAQLQEQIKALSAINLRLEQQNKALQNHKTQLDFENQQIPISNLEQRELEPSFKLFSLKNKQNVLIAMSKFSVSLQQAVNVNQIGVVLFSIQYDGSGPKLLAAKSAGLSEEEQHLVDTIMGLVNMALARGIETKEIAEQLQLEPQDDGIQDHRITTVLKSAGEFLAGIPKEINRVPKEQLMEFGLQAVKKYTESIDASILPFFEEYANQTNSKTGVKKQEPEPTQTDTLSDQDNYSENEDNYSENQKNRDGGNYEDYQEQEEYPSQEYTEEPKASKQTSSNYSQNYNNNYYSQADAEVEAEESGYTTGNAYNSESRPEQPRRSFFGGFNRN